MSGPFGGRRDRPFELDAIPWEQISRWIRLAALGAAGLALLLFGSTMFYRIDAHEEGVLLLFGKMEKDIAPPGLHWKLPWPIETVYAVPVEKVQDLKFGFETEQAGRVTQFAPQSSEHLAVAEMLTGDLNLGHVEWIVQYQISDPKKYLFKVGGEVSTVGSLFSGDQSSEVNPAVPDTIRNVSEAVMRKLVGDSSIDYGLTIGREQIAQEAEQLIQEELDFFETGVEIITVKLQTTSPPTAEVQDAFQEVNRARQRADRVLNEALGEKNSQIPAADGDRLKAIAEAEGYQKRIVLETTGRTEAFLAQLKEYQIAPEVTRKRLYLEAMEEILAAVGSKTIIDESVRGIVPFLNLDAGGRLPAVQKGGRP